MFQAISWQRAEAAFLFALGFVLYAKFGFEFPWWIAALLFLAPDLSFAAYAFGPKAGAIAYNLIHSYGSGAILLCLGFALASPVLLSLGGLWLAHSGFDRVLGYGLKSSQGFHDTHLGKIGKNAKTSGAAD